MGREEEGVVLSSLKGEANKYFTGQYRKYILESYKRTCASGGVYIHRYPAVCLSERAVHYQY